MSRNDTGIIEMIPMCTQIDDITLVIISVQYIVCVKIELC